MRIIQTIVKLLSRVGPRAEGWLLAVLWAAGLLGAVGCTTEKPSEPPVPTAELPAPSRDETVQPAPPSNEEPSPKSAPATEGALDPDDPFTQSFWQRIQELVGADCSTGFTESVDLEVKDGKITFWEGTDDQPDPKMVGTTVPRAPKEHEAFFTKRIFVGICIFYVKQR